MTCLFTAELVNKFSTYIKTIGNRIIEVEFSWYQTNPYENYQLNLNEKQFNERQIYIRSKSLSNITFEKFVDLTTSIFANDATEISNSVLHSTFKGLCDQNSNETIDLDEFDSLFILLHGFDTYKLNILHGNLQQIFGDKISYISFKEFHDAVKRGYLRQLLMN